MSSARMGPGASNSPFAASRVKRRSAALISVNFPSRRSRCRQPRIIAGSQDEPQLVRR